MARWFIFPIIISLFLVSCKVQLPDFTHLESERIQIGPGPEDMVLDESTGSPRLLISSTERRNDSREEGAIYAMDIATERVMEMTRTGEPEGFILRPHGIDLRTDDDETLLYVVSHSPVGEKDIEHQVVIYSVKGNELEFEESLQSQLLISPNDLSVLEDGTIYVTNDAGKKRNIGRFFERLFRLEASNVARYDNRAVWTTPIEGLAYANGILATEDTVIVAPIFGRALMSYALDDMKVIDTRKLAELKGLDNITVYDDAHILIATHPKFMAFLKHYKKPEKLSPGIVYKVNRLYGYSEPIFADDGSRISANSTALYYDGYLYIGQVFEPYILKVRLEE